MSYLPEKVTWFRLPEIVKNLQESVSTIGLELINDTSPQLGGQLDLNGNTSVIDGVDNVWSFDSVGKAVIIDASNGLVSRFFRLIDTTTDNYVTISNDNIITADRAWSFPNKSDTFAGLSDIGYDKTGYTVATLPGTPTSGDRTFVTDSSVAASGNFGATVIGGGANTVPVFYDGSNWIIA